MRIQFKSLYILLIGLSFILAACSSESNSSGGNTTAGISVTGVVVSVVDVNNQPVKNKTVQVTSKSTGVNLATGVLMTGAGAGTALTTDAYGNVNVKGLTPGEYTVEFTTPTGPVKIPLKVSNDDKAGDNKKAMVVAPVSQDNYGNITNLPNVLVGSLSGSIGVFASSPNQPLAGATITLSTPNLGMIASSTTGAYGEYALVINIASKLSGELGNTTLTVTFDGYNQHKVVGLQITPGTNLTGLDIGLTAMSAAETAVAQSLVIQSFDFEGASASNWTATGLWHTHSNGLNIINEAVTDGLVDLAPNDTSTGLIPDAAAGTKAMWFGREVTVNGQEKGNFLEFSDLLSNTFNSKTGGDTDWNLLTSVSGTLTSPVIDLSSVTSPYVSLTFDTWWEIESVNPNLSGFDLMTVLYSLDSGITWSPLARLNPLADPYTDINRASIPYSNNGFNIAPSWIQQENIPLIDPYSGASLAGQPIMLQFSFDTVDTMYNGFRGWLLDNVVVEATKGTYPTVDPFAPIGGGAMFFDWIYLAWDPVTYNDLITPPMYDLVSYSPTILTAGSPVNFSATLDYEAVSATHAQLMVSVDGSVPVADTTTKQALTPGSMQQIILTGTGIPPVGSTAIDIWVQMLDALGNEVLSVPVAWYYVQ